MMMVEGLQSVPFSPQEDSEHQPLNLKPRHQDLVPTPCGPRKRWSELSCPLRLYYSFTILSLLVLVGITLSSIVKQRMSRDVSDEDNFTVSLILLFGTFFCIYYISRGVLQENRQEMIAFIVCIIVIMVRSLVNFFLLRSKGKQELEPRFLYIMVLSVIHIIICIVYVFWVKPRWMAFRVGGALESLQNQYFLLNLCFSMVTFDLQAQLCLCILITTTESNMSPTNAIILGVGVVWAVVVAAVGAVAVLKEVKVLVWIFMVLNLLQVPLFIYVMYEIIKQWYSNSVYTLEAAAVTGALVSLLIKGVLLWALVRLVQNFGQGLRERMFTGVEMTEPEDEGRR
ncbi:uncharacterized protein LOC115421813 isoform X2 [Sphaeramia orbicularis]|uniref:Uncharacterized LOC115421813 n=1 Tax=Sphaeramia orbicularis TaxID=375764 RepID=A0A672YSY2_9TELE|nr:uncharacterized protein LOC115421813 isoform X2 [Sphaeramia orbicularis]